MPDRKAEDGQQQGLHPYHPAQGNPEPCAPCHQQQYQAGQQRQPQHALLLVFPQPISIERGRNDADTTGRCSQHKQSHSDPAPGEPGRQLGRGQRHDQRDHQRSAQAQFEGIPQQTALVACSIHLGDQYREPLQHPCHCYRTDQLNHRLQLCPERHHGWATGQRQHLVQSGTAQKIGQDDDERGQNALDGSQFSLMLY